MSPAPVRRRPARFPNMWGYGLAVFLMLAAIGVAVFFVVDAIRGFSDDVRNLHRVANQESLTVALEEGEYLVFDEDGLDVGPFDVRVFRAVDDLEVPTVDVVDGTSYDVDGRRGEARVAFDVPTSSTYRIEVDTSVGDVARFAVGGDVVDARNNGIVRGLVFGAVLFILGFVVLVWTLATHARWRLRSEIERRAGTARDAIAATAEPAATPDARRERADEAAGQAATWARERLERLREALPTVPGDHGRAPNYGDELTRRAGEALDTAEARVETWESTAGESAAGVSGPADLASRIDEALTRVQDRVRAGDRLRDIAADERAAAEQTAAELAERAREARTTATAAAAELEERTLQRVAQEAETMRAEAAAYTTDALDAVTAQADEQGDELIAGAAAAAGGALATGTEYARARGREVLGVPAETPELLEDTETSDAFVDDSQQDWWNPPAVHQPPTEAEWLATTESLPEPPPSVEEWRGELPESPPDPPPAAPSEIAHVEPEPPPTMERPRSASILAPPPRVRPLRRPANWAVPTAAADGVVDHGGASAKAWPPGDASGSGQSEAGAGALTHFGGLAPPPTALTRQLGASSRPVSTAGAPAKTADRGSVLEGDDNESPDETAEAPAARPQRSFSIAPPPPQRSLGSR